MKKTLFVIYIWGSTFLFVGLLYWLATIPNLQAGNQVTDQLIKVISRMALYAGFFILLYRSAILTLKSTVERLSAYRSKGEQSEDAEFVLIIETLVVIVCMLSCVLFSFFEEYVQFYVTGRNGNDTYLIDNGNNSYSRSIKISEVEGSTYINLNSVGEATKDILVSTMSVILTGMIVYSMPVIGELEIAIKHKIEREIKELKKKK